MGETMDFFKETNKELKKNDELLQCIHDWAVELGMDPYHINSTNIKQKLDKVVRTYLTLESKAKELSILEYRKKGPRKQEKVEPKTKLINS